MGNLKDSTIERNIGGNIVLTTPPVRIQMVLKHVSGRNFVPVSKSLTVIEDDGLHFRLLSDMTLGTPRLNHVTLIDQALAALEDPREREARDRLAAAQDSLLRAEAAVQHAQRDLRAIACP